MSRDSVLPVVIVVLLSVLAIIAIGATEPRCKPGQRPILSRYSGWFCADKGIE